MTAAMDREAILRRFEAWLDGILAQEEPPAGIPAEILNALEAGADDGIPRRCDLYSMWAAVTALTQEVKLQGRSFKQLSEALAPASNLHSRVETLLASHEQVLAEMRREAEQRSRREVLDGLLDVRDRLGRGLESARAVQLKAVQLKNESKKRGGPAGWMESLFRRPDGDAHSAEALAAFEKGYELSVSRLDEILAQFHVREIACRDLVFDPRSMSAVDIEETTQVPEGTVLEVYRPGYEWKGEVYRTAQVKVARLPSNGHAARSDPAAV
ncbi:MAG: nucleotide exchange factor GrpE [Bryobacteraceae bacterium]